MTLAHAWVGFAARRERVPGPALLLAPPAVVARSGTPFAGQQRANDCFARVGFVNVDLVDHGAIVVHNAVGQPCHVSVPTLRAFSAEQSRRSKDTERASSAESFQ